MYNVLCILIDQFLYSGFTYWILVIIYVATTSFLFISIEYSDNVPQLIIYHCLTFRLFLFSYRLHQASKSQTGIFMPVFVENTRP